MKTLKLTSFTLIMVITASAAITACEKKVEKSEEEKTADWYNSHVWLNGLELVPHPSIDKQEFARQYTANQEWWDKSFEFLRTNDLDTISPGRYIIDEGNATAFVSIGQPNELDEIKWETHDNFTDLQYIVQGKTLMGIAPRTSGTVTEPYDSRRDITFYDVDGELLEAGPGSFFLFFPTDIHRPAVRVEGYDEVKRVLIKIRSDPPEEL